MANNNKKSRLHVDKALLAKLNENHKKAFSVEICMHPEAPINCDGGIIAAHTIQRSINLSSIAVNDQIYQLKADLFDLDRTNGEVVLKKVFIKSATTFNGFCAHHDRTTFAPVENKPYVGSVEQAALLGYRSLAKELYNKNAAVESVKINLTMLQEIFSPDDLNFTQASLLYAQNAWAMNLGAQEISKNMKYFHDAIQSEDYSDFYYAIFHSNSSPGALCATAISPEFDFSGRRLQKISDLSIPLEYCTIAIQCTSDGADIIFLWHKTWHSVASAFVESLSALPYEQQGDAIVRMVFDLADNIAINPSWWDRLAVGNKDHLLRRAKAGTATGDRVTNHAFKPDGRMYGAFTITSVSKSY